MEKKQLLDLIDKQLMASIEYLTPAPSREIKTMKFAVETTDDPKFGNAMQMAISYGFQIVGYSFIYCNRSAVSK
jgi:hypothetical protein